MTIRRAKQDDLHAICRLSNEINAYHHAHLPNDFIKPDGSSRDEPYWQGFIGHDNSAVFVAEENEVLVGAVAVSVSAAAPYPFLTSRPRAHIATIVVTERCRGRGIGKQLMSAAEVYAQEKGAADIKLEVMDFNSSALEFYRELGYGNFALRLCKSLQ